MLVFPEGVGGMNKLLRILTFNSVKDLLRYKSFFLLIFLLMLADRMVHRWVKSPGRELQLPEGLGLTLEAAQYVFTQMPSKLAQLVFTPKVVLIAAGLFLLEQENHFCLETKTESGKTAKLNLSLNLSFVH